MQKNSEQVKDYLISIYNKIIKEENEKVIIAFNDLSVLFYLPNKNIKVKNDAVNFKSAISVLFENENDFNRKKETTQSYTNLINKDNILSNIHLLKASVESSYLLGFELQFFKNARRKIMEMPNQMIQDLNKYYENDNLKEFNEALNTILNYFVESNIVSKDELTASAFNNMEKVLLLTNHFTKFYYHYNEFKKEEFEFEPKSKMARFETLEVDNLEYFHEKMVTNIIKDKKSYMLDALEMLLTNNLINNTKSMDLFYDTCHHISEKKVINRIGKQIGKRFNVNDKYFLLKEESLTKYILSFSKKPYFKDVIENIVKKSHDTTAVTFYLNRLFKNNEEMKEYVFLLDLYNKNVVTTKKSNLLLPKEHKIYTFDLNIKDIIGDAIYNADINLTIHKFEIFVKNLLPEEQIECLSDALKIELKIIKEANEELEVYVIERLNRIIENNGELLVKTDTNFIPNVARQIMLEENLEKLEDNSTKHMHNKKKI